MRWVISSFTHRLVIPGNCQNILKIVLYKFVCGMVDHKAVLVEQKYD